MDYDAVANFCLNVIEFLNDEHGIDVGVKVDFCKRSHHDSRYNLISLGYKGMIAWAEVGMLDYKTVHHVWVEAGLPVRAQMGWESIYRIVLHEFAHALQLRRPNGRPNGSVHNAVFKEQLAELIEIYPFEEFEGFIQ